MTDHVSLRDLCRTHGRIPSTVLEALARERFDDLGLPAPVADELAAYWLAEDEQRTAAELARQRATVEKVERERNFREGERLLEEVGARLLDLQFTITQLDATSHVDDIEVLEARQQDEMEDHLVAVNAWAAWKREHPEMAAAVEVAAGKGVAVGAETGPWKPPPPNWHADGVWAS